jgi:outer membrane protein assembly factor BamB
LIDGKMYAASEQGDLYVLAAEPTFKLLAKNVLDKEVIRATPAVANGCLFIRTEAHLYCIAGKK